MARTVLRSLCGAAGVGPYALFPLLDTHPLPRGSLSQSVMHVNGHSTAPRASREEDGTSPSGGDVARGLATIVYNASPALQVRCVICSCRLGVVV